MRIRAIHPKVSAGALGGALAIIIVWLIQQFGHITVPGEVGSAISMILGTVVGYLAPSDDGLLPAPVPQEPPHA